MTKLLARANRNHSCKRNTKINRQDFFIFIEQGGTKALREIQSNCLYSGINLSTKSMRFSRFDKNLQLFFLQSNITYLFTSHLVENAIKSKSGKIAIKQPIPWEWQKYFLQSDFRLARVTCHTLWKMSLYKRGLQSLMRISLQILSTFSRSHRRSQSCNSADISIWASFARGKILSTDIKDGFTFGNWLRSRPEFLGKNLSLYSKALQDKYNSKENFAQFFDVPHLEIPSKRRVHLVRTLLHVAGLGLVRAIRGKPEFLSISWELGLSLIVESANVSKIPDYLFFDESDGIIRPLWTYVAEEMGRKIIHVCFSNSDSPALLNEKSSTLATYSCASWSTYWTVDDYQSQVLAERTKLSGDHFKVVGLPWRDDFHMEFPRDNRKQIAIFDYEMHEGYFGMSTINDVGYFDEKKEISFLSDLIEIAEKFDFLLLHKVKREIPKHKRSLEYSNLLQKLDSHPNYFRVNSKVSPHRLIRASDLVISLPLTSTALLAHSLDKLSIYYDPIGKIHRDDMALRKILLIQSRELLEKYIIATL